MSIHKWNIDREYNIPMSNKELFAQRFRDALVRASIKHPNATQGEHAKAMGIAQSTVSKYSSGFAMPASDTAVDIAQYLDVNFEWLMTGRGPMNDKEATLDYLDISDLPEDANVAMRATVHQIKEQAATYRAKSNDN